MPSPSQSSEPAISVQTSGRPRSSPWARWRLLLLFGAFALIAINPLTNYYLHNNFVQGWYQSLGIGNLWFVSPLEGLESLLITRSLYAPSLVGMLIPVLVALYLGRVFCSWLCPVSFLLEVQDRLRRRLSGKKQLHNRLVVVKQALWFTLLAEVLLSLVLGAPVFVFLSPPGLVGREMMMLVFFHKLALEGMLLLGIVSLEFVTRRFFCRSFCPLGGLLAFFGRFRRLQVVVDSKQCSGCGRCRLSCPMGLDPAMGESTGAYCWNCGECVDACRDGSLQFRWRQR